MRRLAVLSATVALAIVGSIGVGNSAPGPHTINTIGRNTFIKNALIQSTFRFAPERNFVAHGGRVVLRNNNVEPHTFTIVPKKALPRTVEEVFSCKICRKIPPKHNAGKKGINKVGDSRFVEPHHKVSFHVTAPAGKVLYFMCEIHPWMQGKIIVH